MLIWVLLVAININKPLFPSQMLPRSSKKASKPQRSGWSHRDRLEWADWQKNWNVKLAVSKTFKNEKLTANQARSFVLKQKYVIITFLVSLHNSKCEKMLSCDFSSVLTFSILFRFLQSSFYRVAGPYLQNTNLKCNAHLCDKALPQAVNEFCKKYVRILLQTNCGIL